MPLDPTRFEVVDDDVAAVLRDKTPSQRVEMAFQAEAFARTLTAAGVKSRHPEWNAEEIEQEIARIWLLGSE